jgi:hypothetical protein
MKYLAVLVLGLTMLVASCNKHEASIDVKVEETEKLSVEDQSFVTELEVALSILKDGDVLEVTLDRDGYTYKITDKAHVQNQVTFRKERCRGSGVSFARCVKKAVMDTGCQKITMDGDDFVSNDC